MSLFIFKRERILLLMLVAPLVYIASVWGVLPDQIPTHWGFNGKPDSWGGKGAVFIGPGIALFMYLLLLFIPKIDPKRIGVGGFDSAFYKIRVVLGVFMFAISVFTIYSSVPGSMDLSGKWLIGGISLLFGMMGNVMINVKPNWFVGIRTPWTLSSDEVWRSTHRLGGRMWFWTGLLGFPLVLLFDGEWVPGALFGVIIGTSLIAVVYSYVLFKREKAVGSAQEGVR